ncbi:MAG: acyl-CoA dehydrogenase family protein, partial [Thermoanaerobaculia bacterium]|nr:acyl-CoA dehydrogenase family protein [Thermoanaerobaculia bacterium]
ENSLGKLVGAPLRQQMSAFAMEIQGAAGLELHRWQRQYLGAPGGRIAGGSDEIMRNIIAERILRLPPEARLDKDVAFKDVPTGHGG